jgi:hypothetical protein
MDTCGFSSRNLYFPLYCTLCGDVTHEAQSKLHILFPVAVHICDPLDFGMADVMIASAEEYEHSV